MAHIATGAGTTTSSSHSGNIGANIAGGSVSSFQFTYTATGTSNAVMFWVAMVPNATSPTTCSLTATGWTFSQIGGIINGGTSAGCAAMFSAYAPNTSLATITCTWNQIVNGWFNDLIDEFSGVDGTTVAVGNNSATGTGTPTVSVTPTANNATIWVATNDSVTAVGSIGGSTATKGADDLSTDWSEYRTISGGSGSAQSCTFTGSSTYIIGAVAIQPPGGIGIAPGTLTSRFVFFDTGQYSLGA